MTFQRSKNSTRLPTVTGFPGGSEGKRICLQCGRPGFKPWVGKNPWRREQLPTPVFVPGESPWTEEPSGLQSMESQRIGHNSATGTLTVTTYSILCLSFQKIFSLLRYCPFSSFPGVVREVNNLLLSFKIHSLLIISSHPECIYE